MGTTRLAEAPCFAPLLRALDLGAAPLATDAAPFFREAGLAFELAPSLSPSRKPEPLARASSPSLSPSLSLTGRGVARLQVVRVRSRLSKAQARESVRATSNPNLYAQARLSFELCGAALDLEDAEPKFAATATAPAAAASDFRAASGRACGAGARQMVGTLLPAVPVVALRELLLATARAIEPLASTAVGEAGEPAEEEQEEEDDEASGAQLAAVSLGGALLNKAAALLAPPGVDDSGSPAAADAARCVRRWWRCCSASCRAPRTAIWFGLGLGLGYGLGLGLGLRVGRTRPNPLCQGRAKPDA